MTVKIKAHPLDLAKVRRGVVHWKVPAGVRKELAQFLDDLALGKVNRGKRISEARQAKYLDLLHVPLQFLNTPTTKLRVKDIEQLEKALTSDTLKNRITGRPYAHSTKCDMRKALKIFFRWRRGPAKALELAGWLDTRDRHKTPNYLSEHEVEALYKACSTADQRYLVAMLFDVGCRVEEFLNVRYEDIQLPGEKDSFVKLTLRDEYSKTLGRTVSLYWRYSAEAVGEYVRERAASGLKAADPVFPKTYNAIRMFLRRLGNRVLRKHLHAHLFRHSSATYYASRLNRQELCYRYGWRFSSNMPDVYISRAGMENKNLDEKFTQTELGTVKDELEQVQQATRIKDERIHQLEEEMRTMRQNLDAVSKALSLNPTISEVERVIRKKRAQASDPQPTGDSKDTPDVSSDKSGT